jgi:GT2 family glycosyltransferase
MIDVTFIVCTRDRAYALLGCLDAIAVAARNSQLSTELVLVDNGSKDATGKVAAEWARAASIPVKIVYEPRPGLGGARNLGIAAASGRILAFTDDDCRVKADYLVDLERHHADDTGPAIRGGRVELGDPTDIRFSIKCDLNAARLTPDVHPGGLLLGCNMTMVRDVIDRIGLFDERFGAGAPFRSGEETEFLYRAYRAGIVVEYVPDMCVVHFHGRKGNSDLERLNFGYHFGNGAMYAKYLTSDLQLMRHLYWTMRGAAKELFGGQQFKPDLNLSHRSVVTGTISGFMSYWSWQVRSLFGRRAQQ